MTTAGSGVELKPAWEVQEPSPPAVSIRVFLAWVAAWLVAFVGVSPLAKWITRAVLGLDENSRIGSTVSFFLYDAPRVILLLTGAVFWMGIGNSYFTAERAKRFLTKRGGYVGNVLAALLGVVTPFCSCSAVPLFIGFVEGGIPLGVTFSFLVAAPMVNELAVILLAGLLGWRIALVYLCTGLSIAVVAGIVMGHLRMEDQVESWVRARLTFRLAPAAKPLTFGQRAHEGVLHMRKVLRKVWLFILIGIGIGAAIQGYVPENALRFIMGHQQWWSVPVVVALGIPLYINSLGLMPIVAPLLAKGAAVGTVLAFMMAAIGLSLPEMIVLRRVLRMRLVVAFVGVVGSGILATGWMFNMLF